MPGNTVIETGVYYIVNVYSQNNAATRGKKDGEPLCARTDALQDMSLIQWNVYRHKNGLYTIKNRGTGLHAQSPYRPTQGATIEGLLKSREQLWKLVETRVPGTFSILSTQQELFWALEDKEMNTPITHYDHPANPYTHWKFVSVEPEPPITPISSPTSPSCRTCSFQTGSPPNENDAREKEEKELESLHEQLRKSLDNEQQLKEQVQSLTQNLAELYTKATPTDSHSGAQIKKMLTSLNAVILDKATLIAESVQYGTKTPGWENKPEVQDARKFFDEIFGEERTRLLISMNHRLDPSLVVRFLRGVMCTHAEQIIDSWTLLEAGGDDVWAKTYNAMLASESQGDAARWRAFSRKHIGRGRDEELQKIVLDGIIKVLTCAGAFVTSPNYASARSAASRRFSAAAQLVLKEILHVNKAIGQGVVTSDMAVTTAKSDSPFIDEEMKLGEDQAGRKTNQYDRVFCTIELGLHVTHKRDNGARVDCTLLKTTVVLDADQSGMEVPPPKEQPNSAGNRHANDVDPETLLESSDEEEAKPEPPRPAASKDVPKNKEAPRRPPMFKQSPTQDTPDTNAKRNSEWRFGSDEQMKVDTDDWWSDRDRPHWSTSKRTAGPGWSKFESFEGHRSKHGASSSFQRSGFSSSFEKDAFSFDF